MVALSINAVSASASSAEPVQPPDRPDGQRTLVLICGYFLVVGVATVMLGPALPLLAARWRMPDARLGSLFMAYFAGQFCGSWAATPKLRSSLLLGAIAAAIGIFLLAFVGATTVHVALFCAGVGLGAGLTAGNVVVGTLGANLHETHTEQESARHGSSRSRNLSLLNVAWGLGAISCPLLLEASLRIHFFRAQPGQLFFIALAAALALCAVLLVLLLPQPSTSLANRAQPTKRMQIPWQIFALFGATFMLYVGVENSLGGWLPTYAQRLSPSGMLAGRAAAVALCFWICELVSRGLTAVLIKSVREQFFYRSCLVALIATTAALLFIPHPGVAEVFAITASPPSAWRRSIPWLYPSCWREPATIPALAKSSLAPHSGAQSYPGSLVSIDPIPQSADWSHHVRERERCLCFCSRSTCRAAIARTSTHRVISCTAPRQATDCRQQALPQPASTTAHRCLRSTAARYCFGNCATLSEYWRQAAHRFPAD